MSLVTLKIIDNLLRPQIPQICDFFLFTSLKRVLMRTDWLKPASEEVQMSKIHELKKKFVKKFPLVGRDIEMSQLAHQIGKIDLVYFINKENMVTGDPTEEFNSRKTKIKDDNYKSLYDQLVQEWYESEQIERFDGEIIESPKNTRSRKLRKSRMQYIREPENIDDEDLEELGGLQPGQMVV